MSSETILVTDDPSRRRLANQEGFRTRRGLRTLKHLMLGPDQNPPRFVLPDWVPLPTLTSFFSLVGLLIVAGLAVFGFYPQMHVTLVPQTRAVQQSVDVTVDPEAKAADPSTGDAARDAAQRARGRLRQRADSVRSHHWQRQGPRRSDYHQPADGRLQPAQGLDRARRRRP